MSVAFETCVARGNLERVESVFGSDVLDGVDAAGAKVKPLLFFGLEVSASLLLFSLDLVDNFMTALSV